jgi:hypothetical protein
VAGHVLKRRRLVNRGSRRRRMTPKQIRHFGTRAQKAALRRKNRLTHRRHRRRRNVGQILTILPANPARRRNRVARVANRRNRRRNRRRVMNRRNRRNRRTMMSTLPAPNRRRNRRRNRRNRRNRRHTLANPRVVVRYRNRRHNRRNRNHRRRNPEFLKGDIGAVVGVLGGAAVTSILTGFLPSALTTGPVGYISTGVISVVQGQVIGKVTKNSKLGNWMTVGGLVILALKMLNDFFPQLQLPLALTGNSTSGMGLITSSNFFVPQVNVPGSMATFVTPAGVTAAIPVAAPAAAAGLSGLGYQGLRTLRRVGRMR